MFVFFGLLLGKEEKKDFEKLKEVYKCKLFKKLKVLYFSI